MQIKIYTFLFIVNLFSCNDHVMPQEFSCNDQVVPKDRATKIERSDSVLIIKSYGLIDITNHRTRNLVAQKYGIRFINAGCVIEGDAINYIDSMDKVTKQKFGKNWEKKFYKEVAAEIEIDKKLCQILDTFYLIQNMNNKIMENGHTLHYTFKLSDNTNEYLVSAESYLGNDWASY